MKSFMDYFSDFALLSLFYSNRFNHGEDKKLKIRGLKLIQDGAYAPCHLSGPRHVI